MPSWGRRKSEMVEPNPDLLGPPTPGRPPGLIGNTGLHFTAWIGTAHQRLVSATIDDDPRCMRVLAAEAKVAGLTAGDFAVNDRQKGMAGDLVASAMKIFDVAEKTPPLKTPHTHDPVG